VPELEVVSADLALAPPCPDQGIKMPEDSGTGTDPHEHLHKVGEDRHEEDGVGGEVLELKAKLLQGRRKKEEIGGTNPHIAYELKRKNSLTARSRRGILPARILSACSGAVHPRTRCTRSSWLWLWKRRGKGREDMMMDAAIARDGLQGSRKEKECRAQEGRLQMCVRRRRGAAASGNGKSVKVANLCGA
jgi:hypothetical protein